MKLVQSYLASRLKSLIAELQVFCKSVQNITPFILCGLLLSAIGCRQVEGLKKPLIHFERIPPAKGGGRDPLDRITGRVVNGEPGSRIVLYAHADAWYIQPYRSRGFTEVASDGSWSSVTHLGSDYAALLVRSGYRPPAKISALPPANGDILAVAVTKGSANSPAKSKTLHFSGYDWNIRSSPGDRGGEVCDYEPSNAWVDDKGYLHLLMGQQDGQWHCAGVSLTRSLGYGTYRFVISDTSHLPLSPVLAIFTRSDQDDSGNRTGLDIQLSQWGKEQMANAGYVVQPYDLPGNTALFRVPAGVVTHLLQWEPGTAEFRTFRGVSIAQRDVVMDHVFKSGIPVPSNETIHLDFYDFRHTQNGLQHPVEIMVQKFDYLP